MRPGAAPSATLVVPFGRVRALLGGLVGTRQIERGVQQGDVRESLRKIAELSA